MHRLTREVRLGIPADGRIPDAPGPNGYAGSLPLAGLGYYFIVRVSLAGKLNPESNYLLNIKRVDELIRNQGLPLIRVAARDGSFGGGEGVVRGLFDLCRNAWPGITLDEV